MEIINVKLEIKLNKYLYDCGVINKYTYEVARTALINRLTVVEQNATIEYDYQLKSEQEMIKNEIT